MSEGKEPALERTAPAVPVTKFRDMTWPQKLACVGKWVLCVLSFGFIYPNAFLE